MTDIRKQTFGIEIETVGRDRKETAQIVAELFETSISRDGGYYDKYVVRDNKNRKWTFMTDGSLSSDRSCEVVSPVLNYEDIELLQNVVRALRKGGCKTDYSCGIHVHVGTEEVENFARYAKNLSNIVETHYDLLKKALNFSDRSRWCRSNKYFQEQMNKSNIKDEKDVMKLWYDTDNERTAEILATEHYNHSRYHLLNMHSYFQNKGVEFRAFNGTLHAGEIRAYICLCLAMNTQAINKSFVAKKYVTTGENDAFAMNSWLYNMNLAGEEFKNVRKHLMKNLSGNLEYRNGSFTSRRAI